MIQSVVDKGKQAIVLIPEIALTYQICDEILQKI